MKLSLAKKYTRLSNGFYKHLYPEIFDKGVYRLYFPVNIALNNDQLYIPTLVNTAVTILNDGIAYDQILNTLTKRKIKNSHNPKALEGIKKKIQLLEDNGFHIYEWSSYVDGILFNSFTKTYEKAGKVFLNALKADLALSDRRYLKKGLKEFKNDPKRSGKMMIVISRHPYDIASMSTGRSWTSCMSAETGGYAEYLINEICIGSLIAYLTSVKDKNINNPTCRVTIRPYFNPKTGETILLPGNKAYGLGEFKDILLRETKNIVTELNSKFKRSVGKYKLHHLSYDEGIPEIYHYNNVNQVISELEKGTNERENEYIIYNNWLIKRGYDISDICPISDCKLPFVEQITDIDLQNKLINSFFNREGLSSIINNYYDTSNLESQILNWCEFLKCLGWTNDNICEKLTVNTLLPSNVSNNILNYYSGNILSNPNCTKTIGDYENLFGYNNQKSFNYYTVLNKIIRNGGRSKSSKSYYKAYSDYHYYTTNNYANCLYDERIDLFDFTCSVKAKIKQVFADNIHDTVIIKYVNEKIKTLKSKAAKKSWRKLLPNDSVNSQYKLVLKGIKTNNARIEFEKNETGV